MIYAIKLLDRVRRDHLATANELEMRMGQMLDPHTEAAVDTIRAHRIKAEELQRAIVRLSKMEDE